MTTQDSPPGLAQAKWIWLDQNRPRPNQFVCFRRAFTLSESPRLATLDLSVDSNFLLYVNGQEIGCGQFSDWPRDKTYTRYDVAPHLRRGRNVIAILAHHIGRNFSCYRKGKPGLIAALSAGRRVVVTDSAWRVVEHPAFTGGTTPRVTMQLGFTWSFDARRDIAWSAPSHPDSKWSHAHELAGATDGYWRTMQARPVPPLVVGPPVAIRIAAQGWFDRRRELATPAATIAGDALITEIPEKVFRIPPTIDGHDYQGPPINPGVALDGDEKNTLIIRPPVRGAKGSFIIVDLGRQEVGFLELSLTAPRGTVIDVAHGEHLDDGRVRSRIGPRNFADRYICGGAAHRFTMPFRRIGGRFLQLHFSSYRSDINLTYAGLRPTTVPLPRLGAFKCHDPLAEQVHETSVRTLELCMHEHYEDCPWREQALYAYDSRNQALFGYYALGDYDFAAASFDLLGRGLTDEGLLELCAPAVVHVNIPIFSFTWVMAVAEHWLFSGQPTLFKRFDNTVEKILATALDRPDPKTGLYRMPTGDHIWQFYEWTPGLADLDRSRIAGQQMHAGYNLYLHVALRSWAQMLHWSGDEKSAARLQRRCRLLGGAIHQHFWQPDRHHYATRTVRGRRRQAHDHIQALALHEQIVPARSRRMLLSQIYDQSMPSMTLSSLLYMVDALMPLGPAARQFVCNLLNGHWNRMSLTGATSFWETRHGADDFNYAGSLCHGWSALPAYYQQAYVLGIRPTEPGFRSFIISPYPDRFHAVEGIVPTPTGPIHAKWKRTDGGLHVTCQGPSGLSPVVKPISEAPIHRATYNGRSLV
jgi:alpha-L-rhamnosidase